MTDEVRVVGYPKTENREPKTRETRLTERDRFLRTMRYEGCDRRPLHLVGPWPDTLRRWHAEGLPAHVTAGTLAEFFGLQPLRLRNVSAEMGPHPPFEQRTVREDDEVRIFVDRYGRIARDLKAHTSMPEWLEFAVKDRASLQRALDEHYSVENVDERFGPDWEERVRKPLHPNELLLVDGGCYYGILRSLAGVENASYLLHDAPDLVDELFERYHTVVMEGMRRAMARVNVDIVGFGEDIAYKTGTLMSVAMFRRFILPRYRKAMDFARQHGVDVTWYDSDGNLRPFIPDYLSVGINGLAPCEVAADMAPVGLRRDFGRDLRIIGGLDKREIAKGPVAIDAELERNKPLIQEGGFMPAIDHSISADISWDNYRYFLDRLLPALEL
ncbi:MAG: hypothetical protein FJ279_27205 [Planctomycetes bacterium]|nr:hypothetical protein [Planctomycetota bacterium]